MRRLKAKDIRTGAMLAKATGVPAMMDLIYECKKTKEQERLGRAMIDFIIDAIADEKSSRLAYQFLAGPFEMTETEVEELDITVLIEMLKLLIQDNEIDDFFKSVSVMIQGN